MLYDSGSVKSGSSSGYFKILFLVTKRSNCPMGASRNKSDMVEQDWIWGILRNGNDLEKIQSLLWRGLGGDSMGEERCRQSHNRNAEEEVQKADG